MKKLLFPILLLLTSLTYAQTTRTDTVHVIGIGGSGSTNAFDSLRNNSGTLEGRKSGVFIPQFVLPSGGGSTDTTSLSNRINSKLDSTYRAIDTLIDPIQYTPGLGTGLRQSYIDSMRAKEPSLGNPASSGQVLSSTTGGVRSWITPSGGGGGGKNVYDSNGVLSSDRIIKANNNRLVIDSIKTFQINSTLDTVANNIPAQALGYGTIPTTGTDVGFQNVYLLNGSNNTRIRQTGILTQVQFYVNVKPSATLNFVIWRKTGGTFNIVSSQNILSLVTASSTNLITLPTPISVVEGDYTGFSYTSASTVNVFKNASLTFGSSYFTSDPGSSSNFSSATTQGYYVPVSGFVTKSPVIAYIGNSIVAGVPLNSGFINTSTISSLQSSFPYMVDSMLNVVGQNLGIGGATTTAIAARFVSDAISLHPKYAIIEGGLNDITAVSTVTIINNFKTILQSCLDSSVTPFVVLITPCSKCNTSASMQADTVNSLLIPLVPLYNGSIIDTRSSVGQFRSGGTAGNFWDQQAPYMAVDSIHFTPAGYRVIATVAYTAIVSSRNKAFFVDSIGNTNINKALITRNTTGILGQVLQSEGQNKSPIWVNPYSYTLPSFTSGSVLFGNGTTITQNNSSLFWDNTNSRLGVGTNTPDATMSIVNNVAGTSGSTFDVKNLSSTGQTAFLFSNDRAANASYGAVIMPGSGLGGTLFGVTKADKMYIVADGPNSGGLQLGTLLSLPVALSTNNTQRLSISGAGLWSLNGTAGTALQIPQVNSGATGMQWYKPPVTGQTTLVAGTKAISIAGVTTGSTVQVTFVSVGGTVTTTWQYAAVCTSGTVTITALTSAGATDTSDTSTLNYSVTY